MEHVTGENSEYGLIMNTEFLEPASLTYKNIQAFYLEWTGPGKTVHVNTSGSTGLPKVIEISKKAMIESAKQTVAFFNINRHDHLLLCLPVNFIAGKMMMVRSMISESNLIAVEPSANPLLPFVGQHTTINFAAFTPHQVATIIADEHTRKLFKEIDTVIIGGGEIPHTIEKQLCQFNNRIYATYGMTETITHVAVRKIDRYNHGVYTLFNGISPGQDARGCLTLQAAYLGPEKIVTNDMIEFEGPREFSFLGRYDNVINSGGIKLHPEKIEKKLEDILVHPYYIHHRPDEALGQHLVLVIESEPYNDTTLTLLKSSLKDVLDRYEVPKEIEFRTSFERTGNGKIVRK